ncbi:MAG: Uma2 family endonuclease [Acetobacteraceae bacterium]|nr:Uma2 family endonuclease [Acetobacteraceae bacterium]
MVELRKPARLQMTVAEFLDWDSGDGSGARWQLRDGTPEAMAPATEAHGAIQSELIALLRNHLLEQRSECRVITEPGIVPHVHSQDNVRIPDLAVTCVPPSTRRLVRESVLVVEVLSPSNKDETRSNVWTYTTIPRVTEILIVSSFEVSVEILRRRPDGAWPEKAEVLKQPAVLELASVGFRVPLAALYRTTALARR